MQLKRTDAVSGLRKIDGTPQPGAKHEQCKIYVDGRFVAKIPLPGDDTYGDTLISFVAQPLCLNNGQFRDICNCTKDIDWYREHLKIQGKL